MNCAADELPIVHREWNDGSPPEMVSVSTAIGCLSGHLGWQNFLATGSGSSPNCFYSVRPENMPTFREALRQREEAFQAALSDGSK